MTTTDSLYFGPHSVRVEINEVSLRPGPGAHELRIQIFLQAPWLPAEPADARAVLSLDVAIDVETAQQQGPLGHTHASYSVRQYRTNETLTVVLTDDQLLALEALASRDGLRLQIDLDATLFEAQTAPTTATTQMRPHITHTRWLELLDQAGAAVAITVRVPSPLSHPPGTNHIQGAQTPSLSQAAQRLRQARLALRDGDHERCVQTCRAVLEHVQALQPPTPAKQLNPAPRQRGPHQRWSALFHDAYSLCSAATHEDGNAQTFDWTRADAQAVLALTAALLARTTTT
ncbi:hypothetical protein GCM10027517_11940 [Phycicoccus ginsengisoli]